MGTKRSRRAEGPIRAGRSAAPPKRASRAVLILSAFPERGSAVRAARSLVRARILACATVAPGARAFYRWGGRERSDPSVLFWGKTSAARAADAVAALGASHPDRVPEILVLPIRGGHSGYLRWLAGETRKLR